MLSSASRITAAVLGSAALVATAALPAAAASQAQAPRPQRSAVVLGEVQYDSPGRDDRSNRSLNGEWVTVRNNGRQAVNLKGWTLAKDSRHTYHFKNLRLAGRQSVRVHTGAGHDTARDVYQGSRSYIWDNKDTATLRDAHKRTVDTKHWGPQHGGQQHGGQQHGGQQHGGQQHEGPQRGGPRHH
ncbi:lamin tail domain-containing protein [Streptomyces sp. NPDC088725]|uniref:lamin tail domain-containing protein n=1 Tax=Streptomyces sp. NPDC088725 TaxID=3365873 RepID=UPI00381BC769